MPNQLFDYLPPDRLASLLEAVRSTRAGVLGDFCLDAYWFIDGTESIRSLETGKAVRLVRHQSYSLGGAGNVASNLAGLGVNTVSAFGILANDLFGREMRRQLEQAGVDIRGMPEARTPWQTPVYCKPYEGDEEQERLDLGAFNTLDDATARHVIAGLAAAVSQLDVVVVNEQVARGIHTTCMRAQLRKLLSSHPDTVFLFDSRHCPDAYPEAWLKLDEHTAAALAGMKTRYPPQNLPRNDAWHAARALADRSAHPVFVTLGADGCIVCDSSGATVIPTVRWRGPVDPVGAGDSFLAGVAAFLAAGATPVEAAAAGNLAASVTVSELRKTGTPTPADLLGIATEGPGRGDARVRGKHSDNP